MIVIEKGSCTIQAKCQKCDNKYATMGEIVEPHGHKLHCLGCNSFKGWIGKVDKEIYDFANDRLDEKEMKKEQYRQEAIEKKKLSLFP